jgi:hypothetical protein
MSFFYFVLLVAQMFGMVMIIMLPLGIYRAAKKQANQTKKEVFEDREYKVHVLRCRAYLKSRGIKTIY